MGQVSREKTPYTRQQLADTVHDELEILYPGAVTPELAAMLTALVWLESASGSKTYNNNPGNLIRTNPSAKSPGFWYRPTWWTDTKSKYYAKAHASPPTAPQAFRAYMTLNDGTADFLKLLGIPRYEPLIRAARAGNPTAFGEAYKTTGYAPDAGPGQVRSLEQLYREARELFPDSESEPETVEVDPKDNNALAALLAAGAVFVGAKWIFRKK